MKVWHNLIENGIPRKHLTLGTDKYFETFAQRKICIKKANPQDLHEWDEEILDTDLGEANI